MTNTSTPNRKSQPIGVLFVCLGNICRSVTAQHVFEQIAAARGLAEHFHIDSAGTYGGHEGQLADPRMRRAAGKRGYDLTHRSRPVHWSDFEKFDIILAMDDNNLHTLMRLAPSPEAQAKVHRMAEYFTKFPTYDYVPDPYYEGAEGFELVLDMLEDACDKLCDKLEDKIR